MKQLTISLPGGAWTFLLDGDVVVRGLFGAFDEAPVVAADHPVALALAAYADGDVAALDAIRVRQPGGPFHAAVRTQLRLIPAGETLSYRELAVRAGNPAAARAAAAACARNQIPVVVPCHRVVHTDGSLGGYAFGLDVKRELLDFERRAAQRGVAVVLTQGSPAT